LERVLRPPRFPERLDFILQRVGVIFDTKRKVVFSIYGPNLKSRPRSREEKFEKFKHKRRGKRLEKRV
jgi:hypothetical protein